MTKNRIAITALITLFFCIAFAFAQNADQTEKVKPILNPEHDTPEEDRIIGKGDDLTVQGDRVQISGNALVKVENIVLNADYIWADFDQDLVRAFGNVRLIAGDEETFSNELLYNLTTREGIVREGFTFSDPWYYRGKEIFKIDENESFIRRGSITSSSLKIPHYDFYASKIIVKTNKELIAKHVIFRIGGVPLLYIPAYRRDLRKEKQAKVIFRLGTDNYQGLFMSIELPISRRERWKGSLLYDETSRRGRGGGLTSEYRVNDVKFDEIFIPFFPNSTPTDRTKLKAFADDLEDRLDGEFDGFKLRQLFIPFPITDEDLDRAKTKADEIFDLLQNENSDFATIAQDNSDHSATRYDGGDMGFLIRGETDKDKNLRLDPKLEKIIFDLKEGEISEILRSPRAFHIFKIDQILDLYGGHEIRVRRIDIEITATQAKKNDLREFANQIQKRAENGETFEKLADEFDQIELKMVNGGEPVTPNKMDSRWRYSVKRLETPNEVTRTVMTDLGVSIFQLIEKEPTPSFEKIAENFVDQHGNAIIAEYEKRKAEIDSKKPKEISPQKEKDDDDQKKKKEKKEKKEKMEIFRRHGYTGGWEYDRKVTRQAKQLDRGETSRVIEGKKGLSLIEVKKKRTYRGDLYFYTNDEYSYSRQDAFKIGQRSLFRWGHYHSIYTPWDDREEGRKPLNFMGRIEWRDRDFKEGLGDSESAINSFGMFTWGSAFSAIDDFDTDDDGNLKFSTQTIGEFLGRLQINHSIDLAGDGYLTLQKLPEITASFSRMRLSNLPIFKTINSGMLKISDKLQFETPILSLIRFPTLENASFDLDLNFGNYYRAKYQSESNIYLQAGNIGFDLRKQTTLKFSRTREAMLDLNFNSDLVWHDIDQDGNRHIIRPVYEMSANLSNILFRVYDVSFIPGLRRMRHQINSTLSANFAPSVDEEDNLYPFGPSTYFYERKNITYRFDTSIEIKTQRTRSPLRVISFRTRLRADFTDYAKEWNRTYDQIESNLTVTPLPSRKMNITIRTTHDANRSELDGKRFKQIGFRSNLNYRREKWNFSFGNAFSKRTSRASRRINASFQFRPSRLLEIDTSIDYDWIERQFYSQSVTFRRNLREWDLRLSWHRIGIKRQPPYNNVRQDFTFQINLIADPTISVGLGYDATTETWGFRSLPVGVPYNAFGVGNAMSRSYF